MNHKPALSPELISLVHHIELDKAGWWNRATDRLLISAFWLTGESMSVEEAIEKLKSTLNIEIDNRRTRTRIDSLCAANILIPLPNDKFRISEVSLAEFTSDVKKAESIEEQARDIFLAAVKVHCPSFSAQDTWASFNTIFLLPLLHDIGAKSYDLVSGSLSQDYTNNHFTKLLELDPTCDRNALRAAIGAFLDPGNEIVRAYVLGCLNAHFLVEAGNLREQTLEAIAGLVDRRPVFNIILDTNVLFSLLELHDNPSNEAALSLLELVRELSAKVRVGLYVMPLTIDESKRVLHAHEERLKGLRLTSSIAEAALNQDISGITKRFFQKAKASGYKMTPQQYFDFYLKDLLTVMRGKGVELFNANTGGYATRQEVVDDILAQLDFHRNRGGKISEKSYEQVQHDMILWHYVRGRRPVRYESPLEAEYWIVTVDYNFLAFDAFKRRSSKHSVPICLHPTNLIQMLQFWIPRTPQFEAAMVGSLRLPFLFREFDPESEKVTLSILQRLSQFENVENLSKESVTAILVNDALRTKMHSNPELQEQIALIKDAIIEEHDKLTKSYEMTQKELEAVRRQALENQKALDRFQAVATTKEQQLLAEQEALLEKLAKLDSTTQILTQKNREEEVRRAYIVSWVLYPLLFISIATPALAFSLKYFLRIPLTGETIAGCAILLVMAWAWLANENGISDPAILEWRPFARVHKYAKVIIALLAVMFAGIVSRTAYDTLTSWWHGIHP